MPVRLLDEGSSMYVLRQRPFQKFWGLYLLATRRIARAESEEVGKMPVVEVGKCSALAVEKAFWRERIRSAWVDSRGCCWVFDAFF